FKSEKTEIVLTESLINLKEVVLSANKVEEKYTDLPVRIDIIQARQIQFGNPQTSAELLQQNGTVFVQQSQLGGGSPVLRGMESNRVLLVVDGVRLNNAIYRAGHLQNAITIDPNVLSRVEVLHGPGSVIYGSDAMGGVVHFYTRNPVLSSTEKLFTSGNAMLRYSSAANEFSQSFNINIGGKKVAAFIGASNKQIGDLRQGSKRISKYGDWGKSLYYADREDGKDVMIENLNPLIQKNSGYSQYDLFAKILYKPGKNYALVLNTQFSNSSDVPRYDRLTEMSGGILKFAEWYYGPQTRGLISLTSEYSKPNLWFDNFKTLVAYQYISEDRISRSFGKSKKKFQEETVNVFSLNVDFFKHLFAKSELRYGAEAISNLVDSKAYNQDIVTGNISEDAASRYPDAGNSLNNFSIYATNNWEISEKFIFSQGIRFNYVNLKAKYTPKMMEIIKFPFDAEMKQDNTAVNGSLGLVYMPGNNWRLTTNLSTGFRAPNIDDVGKVFDSEPGFVIVPNPDLESEYAYNGEVGIRKRFADTVKIDLRWITE
ncbi:MAG: TonB-dependent receptor, partial [Desulfobulbaceae bacterium]|nr:TonB-dependent receptor [Desulfobulbaceae bacterium]